MYIIVNRKDIILDALDNIRYIHHNSAGFVVACDEGEATGVIGSDGNSHYPLMKSDYTNNENAVHVEEISELPSFYKPNETKFNYETREIERVLSLDEAKSAKQEENKKKLAETLANNPLQRDGKLYGCTEEDQNEINLILSRYVAAKEQGIAILELEWHAKHEKNTSWEYKDLLDLSVDISNHVKPFFLAMQRKKEEIYSAESFEELEAIEL